LDPFTSLAFERICRDYLWHLHRAGALDFLPRVIGSWWDDRDEIDVVALGDSRVLLGECKWTARPLGTNVLDDLQVKAQRFLQGKETVDVRYVFFAHSGFTPALKQRAETEGILLVSLADLATP
jgi:hypothetical protein